MIRDLVAVYKEEGMTSHGVVNTLRKLTGKKRIGHAGTLDPYAKGVLVVGIGRAATRQLGQVAGTEKEYITRIRLGMRSTTDDREGKIEEAHFLQIPSEDDVRRVLRRFTGIIPQRPPIFSAIKVGGRAAYKLARAKRHVELQVRQVEAKEIELLEYSWPCVRVRLVTGPGFYVRSLARDLGEALGTGGYVIELERTRVGTYTKEQAVRLSELAQSARDP